jgi:hypothetical protein
MIAWNRLLAGGVRDPLVGHDVLIGLAFGTATTLVAKLHQLVLIGFRCDTQRRGGPGIANGCQRGSWRCS